VFTVVATGRIARYPEKGLAPLRTCCYN